MSTEPWLIPDQDYMPTTLPGTEAVIPARIQITEVCRPAPNEIGITPPGLVYRCFIVNELCDILGQEGQKAYDIETVALDQYMNVWQSEEPYYPHYKVGEEIELQIPFKVLGVWRDSQRGNAYVYEISPDFLDHLGDVIGIPNGKTYEVLAKGTDVFIAELAAIGE